MVVDQFEILAVEGHGFSVPKGPLWNRALARVAAAKAILNGTIVSPG